MFSLTALNLPLSSYADQSAYEESEAPSVYYSEAESEEGKAAKNEAKESVAAEINETAIKSAELAKTFSKPMGHQVADFAVRFVGNPYRYGGTSLTTGADCSGFIMSVYRNFGVSLPHSSSALASVGSDVGRDLTNARPGDIVCYSGHVGLYIGNGQIVHASTEETGIKISSAAYRPIKTIRRIF